MAAGHDAARVHSGAGPRLYHCLRATAGRGLAGSNHRDSFARSKSIALDTPGIIRRGGVRRVVRRNAHPGQQCGGAVSGVRGTGSAPEKGSVGRRRSRATCESGFRPLEGAFIIVIPPPSIPGIGTGGGFTMRIQDRARAAAPNCWRKQPTNSSARPARRPALLRCSRRSYVEHAAGVRRYRPDQGEKLGVPIANRRRTAIETYFGSPMSTTSTSSAAPITSPRKPTCRSARRPPISPEFAHPQCRWRHGACSAAS
jgi:hypothetical protein